MSSFKEKGKKLFIFDTRGWGGGGGGSTNPYLGKYTVGDLTNYINVEHEFKTSKF